MTFFPFDSKYDFIFGTSPIYWIVAVSEIVLPSRLSNRSYRISESLNFLLASINNTLTDLFILLIGAHCVFIDFFLFRKEKFLASRETCFGEPWELRLEKSEIFFIDNLEMLAF